MKTKVEETITETAETCYNNMLSEDNKERIFNPIGEQPILKVPYSPDYVSDIRFRLYKYVEDFLKSKEVATKFTEINDELVAFYKAKSLEISDMENDWIHEDSDAPQNENYGSGDDTFFTAGVVRVMFATIPIWVPLMIAGLALGLAFSPISVPIHLFLSRTARKRKIVEEEYNDFRENTVRKFVSDELKKNIGDNLKQLINKVTLTIKNRLEVLDESTKELLKSRREIIAKCNIIMVHARQMKTMEEKCNTLQRQLN